MTEGTKNISNTLWWTEEIVSRLEDERRRQVNRYIDRSEKVIEQLRTDILGKFILYPYRFQI